MMDAIRSVACTASNIAASQKEAQFGLRNRRVRTDGAGDAAVIRDR